MRETYNQLVTRVLTSLTKRARIWNPRKKTTWCSHSHIQFDILFNKLTAYFLHYVLVRTFKTCRFPIGNNRFWKFVYRHLSHYYIPESIHAFQGFSVRVLLNFLISHLCADSHTLTREGKILNHANCVFFLFGWHTFSPLSLLLPDLRQCQGSNSWCLDTTQQKHTAAMQRSKTQLTYKMVIFQWAQVIDVFPGTRHHSFRSVSDEVR